MRRNQQEYAIWVKPAAHISPCSSMNKLDVGNPAASSLSSCLCAFPGGFSLLTEAGLLHPFFVATSEPQEEGYAAAAINEPTVIAATPVCLSQPSTEGSFPADADVPVDHTWSQDGNIVVILRRSSHTAYWRDSSGAVEEIRRTQLSKAPAPALGLAEVYTGSNGFEGKAIACCLLGAPSTVAAAAAAEQQSVSVATSFREYLIAVGGAFGIECHKLELSRPTEEVSEMERYHRSGGGCDALPPRHTVAPVAATCRPLTDTFRGYPVVALAFSPDSGLMAAASMTGHVKVWDVPALVELPPPPQPPLPPPGPRLPDTSTTRKETAARGRRRGVKKQGFGDGVRAMQPRPAQEGLSDPPALWGAALPMARPTSLAFSPDDSVTFALACWDGKIALFLPRAGAEVAVPVPYESLSSTPKNTVRNSIIFRGREWALVWREEVAGTVAVPRGARFGKSGGTIEDQDGAFLCWCKQPAGSDAPAAAANLAVSGYRVTPGRCRRRRAGKHRHDGDHSDDHNTVPSSSGGTAPASASTADPPPPQRPCESLPESPREPHESARATLLPATATGPGFEIFAGHGLGERVGGVMSSSRPAGLESEPTAERYLIHGLAAGPSSLALYDSDFCLHVVSLEAILRAGLVLRTRPEPAAPALLISTSDSVEAFSAAGDTASIVPPGAAAADAATCAEVSMSRPGKTQVTLVSNDHGWVAAYVWRRHRGTDEDCGAGGGSTRSTLLTEEGLELLLTWRNAFTGSETPDKGVCTGGEVPAGGDDRHLSFLPGELEDSDDGGGDGGNGGVFCADVRWGRLALFTRFVVLVYTRPDGDDTAGSTRGVQRGNSPPAERPAGGWSAYAEHPIVHGLLLGGASTAAPISRRLPEPPADLTGVYLLTILGAGCGASGRGQRFLSIRSLSGRSLACRCPLTPAEGDGDAARFGASSKQGSKAYAPPGYGGGAFVVAADGGLGECVKIWRGTFDEGSCRLDVGPPTVVTSYPWPEPEALRLQGVAGPNCELLLFKESEGSSSGGAGRAGGSSDVKSRWWMTWPEAEIWRWVDAPTLLGNEDLGVSDFVKIFQLEVEEMLSSYSRSASDDGNAPPPPHPTSPPPPPPPPPPPGR